MVWLLSSAGLRSPLRLAARSHERDIMAANIDAFPSSTLLLYCAPSLLRTASSSWPWWLGCCTHCASIGRSGLLRHAGHQRGVRALQRCGIGSPATANGRAITRFSLLRRLSWWRGLRARWVLPSLPVRAAAGGRNPIESLLDVLACAVNTCGNHAQRPVAQDS